MILNYKKKLYDFKLLKIKLYDFELENFKKNF
jgi:hypothetical protein